MKNTCASLVLMLAVGIAPAANAAHYVIQIDKMAFGAAPPHLAVGDTIEWQNNDILRHTATATNKAFDVDLPPHAHGIVTLKHAGTISVACKFHPTMKMDLKVEPK